MTLTRKTSVIREARSAKLAQAEFGYLRLTRRPKSGYPRRCRRIYKSNSNGVAVPLWKSKSLVLPLAWLSLHCRYIYVLYSVNMYNLSLFVNNFIINCKRRLKIYIQTFFTQITITYIKVTIDDLWSVPWNVHLSLFFNWWLCMFTGSRNCQSASCREEDQWSKCKIFFQHIWFPKS